MFLNVRKLVLEGYLTFKRDANNDIVPFQFHQQENSKAMWFFFGQLDESGTQLVGIGRKIGLVPVRNKYYGTIIGYE